MHVADFSPALRQAIKLARETGLTESATRLEERALATYTTSSECLAYFAEPFRRRGVSGKRALLQFGCRFHQPGFTCKLDRLPEGRAKVGNVHNAPRSAASNRPWAR